MKAATTWKFLSAAMLVCGIACLPGSAQSKSPRKPPPKAPAKQESTSKQSASKQPVSKTPAPTKKEPAPDRAGRESSTRKPAPEKKPAPDKDQRAPAPSGPSVFGFTFAGSVPAPGKTLDGPVRMTWPGSNSHFDAVAHKATMSAGRLVSGSIELDDRFRLIHSGLAFDVRGLEITPGGVRAVLGYALPDNVFPGTVSLGQVAVSEDGTFASRVEIPMVANPAFGPGARVLLGGATLEVTAKKGRSGRELSARFDGAYVAIPVEPPAAAEPRDLFFTENPDRSFVFGSASELWMDANGRMRSPRVDVVPWARAPRELRLGSDELLRLFVPLDFGLELTSGHFALIEGRVGEVTLGGRLHLPAEYDAQPIEFASLTRSAAGDGFETEELNIDIPPVFLGEYSYRPNRAQFFMPGPITAKALQRGSSGSGPLPDSSSEIADWSEQVRTSLGQRGLLVWGGVLVAPWSVAPTPVIEATSPPKPGKMPKPFAIKRPTAADRLKLHEGIAENVVIGGSKGNSGTKGPQVPTDRRRDSVGSNVTKDPRLSSSKKDLTADRTKPSQERVGSIFTPDTKASRTATGKVGTRGASPGYIVDAGHRPRQRRRVGTRGALNLNATQIKTVLSTPMRLPTLHARQGGAFRLGSAGVDGQWVLLDDPETRLIGRFKAEVDRTFIRFEQSAVTESDVSGRLLIPYPTNIEIGFAGTLNAEGDVLIPEDGLIAPQIEEGWYLDFWKMSVFPRDARAGVSSRAAPGASNKKSSAAQDKSAAHNVLDNSVQKKMDQIEKERQRRQDGGRQEPPEVVVGVVNVIDITPPPPLVFAQDRILIGHAEMRLEVPNQYGGIEFTSRGDQNPFEMSFALRPNGNIEDANVRAVDAGATSFLGIPFYPHSSSIEVRRYIGERRVPGPDDKPFVGWLVRMEGQLTFNFFGERQVRVHHTGTGAKVPFIEPTATDEQGRPKPVMADSGGALYIDARLKFVNTFGMTEAGLRGRFPPKNVDPTRPYEPDGGDNLAIEPFKAFIGNGTIELVGALSVNGLAEAGQWLREDGELNGYEKIGVGGGADVIKATLAVVRGVETVADIGGGVIEIVTGAKGLGAEVIHVGTDAVKFGSSVVTTVAVIAAAATTGTTATQIADEVRHLIGNGLELSSSTVSLLKKIYEQEPWYEPTNPLDPTTDPPYIAMEVLEILLDAAALGVNFEDLTPEEVASVMVRALDEGIEIMKNVQTGDVEADRYTQIGLAVSHVVVGAARMLIEEQGLTEEQAWVLAQRAVVAAKLFSEIPEIRQDERFQYLPLGVATAQVAIDIGSSLRFGDEVDIAAFVDLSDQLLTLTCQDPTIVAPLFDLAQVSSRDAMNVMASSQTVFDALNKPAFFEGQLTPQQAIAQILLPMIDGFVEGSAAGECAGVLRYDPYDAEARALLRVARQVLRLSTVQMSDDVAEIDHHAMLEWAVGTVSETMYAVDVLQPGAVDQRVLTGLTNFHQAVAEIDPDQPAATQVLQFSGTMMPTVRDAVSAIPDIDPVAPKVVDVVAAGVNAAIPLSKGEVDDVAVWLDGSLGVVRSMQELPLRADARAGLGIAARALELGRDGARNQLSPPQMVRGAQEIIDLLRVSHEEGVFQPSSLLASNDPLLVRPVLGLSEADITSALTVASAVLDALATTLETGTLSIASLQTLVERVVTALAPEFRIASRGPGGVMQVAQGDDGFAALGAMLTGLGVLDPFTDADKAATAVMQALLDDAEKNESDPAVIEAINRARGALVAPSNRVANVSYKWHTGYYDDERSYHSIDSEGGTRTAHIRIGQNLVGDPALEIIYEFTFPAGHSAHPHGLNESYRFPISAELLEHGDDVMSKVENMLLQEDMAPQLREYGLEDGGKVRYESRKSGDLLTENFSGVVYVTRPTDVPGIVDETVFEVFDRPRRGQAAASLSGTLLQARWYEPDSQRVVRYDYESGRLRIEHVGGERDGAREVREVPAGAQFQAIDQIPTIGTLLAYVGPHPAIPGMLLEYRQGAPDLLVWKDSSYDRLVVDGRLTYTDPLLIPVEGQLIERRRHDDEADEDWFYRPGFHALKIDSCGDWEMYSLGPFTDLVHSPNPAADMNVGELLVRGTSQGSALRADGVELSPLALETMRITLQPDAVWIATPEGGTELLSTAGLTVLSPGSRRELEAGFCDDGTAPHRVENTPLGQTATRGNDTVAQSSSTAITIRTRKVGQQINALLSRGNDRRFGVAHHDARRALETLLEDPGDPEVLAETCIGDDPLVHVFDFKNNETLVDSGLDHAQLTAPSRGDPQRARKTLFLNSFEQSLQELLVFPSVDAAFDLLQEVDRLAVGGRGTRGVGARARRAIARALDQHVREQLAVLEEMTDPRNLQTAQLEAWLSGSDPGNPLDQLLMSLGIADDANLIWSQRIAAVFLQAYPEIEADPAPIRQLLELAGDSYQSDCFSQDTKLRAQGVYQLAKALAEQQMCGPALIPHVTLGLQSIEQSLNSCEQLLTPSQAAITHGAGNIDRSLLKRHLEAVMRKSVFEQTLGLDNVLGALPTGLVDMHAEQAAAKIEPDKLKDLTLDRARERIRDYLGAEADRQSIGSSSSTALAGAATAADSLVARLETRLQSKLGACNMATVLGSACDLSTLNGCTLRHPQLRDCDVRTITKTTREYLDMAVEAISLGGDQGFDSGLIESSVRVGLVGAFDRADLGNKTRDIEKVRQALQDAQEQVESLRVVGSDQMAVLTGAMADRLGDFAVAIEQKIALTNMPDDGFEDYDRTIQIGLETVARGTALGSSSTKLANLRTLVTAQAPVVQDRDIVRLQAELAEPFHDVARIEMLASRVMEFEGYLATIEQRAPSGAAPNVVRQKFVELFRDHPERLPGVPDALATAKRRKVSTYVRMVIEAWLLLDRSETTTGRAKAAGYLTRVAQSFSIDETQQRNALRDLLNLADEVIEADRVARRGSLLNDIPPQSDPLLAAAAAIASRLGDMAVAVRFGTYDEEKAERFAEAMNDKADAMQVAVDELSAEGATEEDLAEARDELQRVRELAEAASDTALRFRAFRGDPEFDELELIAELELFSRDEPLTINAGAKSGKLVSPKLLSTGSPNRFANAAAALEPVLDRAGAHVRLVHRLGSALPKPKHGEDAAIRLAAIPALTGYIVGEMGLIDLSASVNARGSVQPAALGQDVSFNPEQLLTAILQLTQIGPGRSPGPQVALLVKELLGQLGQDVNDPIVKVGLTVTAASVDGLVTALVPAAQGQPVNWIAVIEASAEQLANVYEPGAPPEDFWLGIAGRTTQIGLQVLQSNGDPNVAAAAALQLSFEFLEYPDVARIVDEIPDPGGQLVVTVKELMGDTLNNIEGGDAFDIALARVISDAAFAQVPAPYGPFGQDLSMWALDFANANRAEITAAVGNPDDPLAWSGVTRKMLEAEGIPRLTCIVNEHIDQLNVPPGVVMLPFVGAHELLASRELFEGDDAEKPKVLLDVAAGLTNLWLSGAAQATCANPLGISEDTPFAQQVRGLKSFDGSEPGAAFNLVGAFGLGAVSTLAPGTTMARALNVVWWGQEDPPTDGSQPTGIGALTTLDPGDAIEFAMGTPKIAGDVIAILSEDPALEKTMDILGGNCEPEYLLPPDTCYPRVSGTPTKDEINKATLPNLMLSLLADMRRATKPELSRSQHNSHPQWGYLKTLPSLSGGIGGIVNPLNVTQEQWQQSTDIASAMEESLTAMQKGTLAMVDVGRSTVNILNSLPGSETIAGPTAASIQNASVFVEQTGGPMFSGVAGGLMREWELGTDPANADIYFELIGQLRIPALFNSATQFTYQNVGDDWMMMLRSGSNFPDATAMAESMGLALPLDDLVGAAIGQSQENFAGWMGVADEEPYLQVFAKKRFELASVEFTEATLSGYVDDLSAGDIQEKFANMDFGICAEVEQALIPPGNPYISLFTLGQTPVATVGGYMQKKDNLFSMGFKSGFAVDVTVPVIPVVGIRSGIDIGGFGEVELDGTWFPDMQLGGCARPYVSGSFFGIELGEVDSTIDFALFGDIDDPNAEAGMKMRLRIADEQYDTMRENLSCEEPPGPVEWAMCGVIDLAGEDLGAWLTLTNEAVYFGLGRFPENGEEALHAPILADGSMGLPGFRTVTGWGGFQKGDFDTCADDICGTIDAPPPGARYYDQPSLEGGGQ